LDYIKTNILPDRYYHLFNHANNKLNLFNQEQDYNNFLKRFQRYIAPISKTLAYCLMPNHYHFFIKIKSEEKISKLKADNSAEKIIANRLKNFIISYSRYYQKTHKIKGSIFQQKTKRIEITEDDYFFHLVGYIHMNPVNHGFVDKPEEWSYSSYRAFKENSKSSIVATDYVMNMYGNEENFDVHHEDLIVKKYAKQMELTY